MIPGLPSVPRSPSSPFRSCPPHPTLTFPSLSLKGAHERENRNQREHPSLLLAFSPPRKLQGCQVKLGRLGTAQERGQEGAEFPPGLNSLSYALQKKKEGWASFPKLNKDVEWASCSPREARGIFHQVLSLSHQQR